MSCFWTDKVNCFEECGDDCTPFADVLPSFEAFITVGAQVAGWTAADVDSEAGTFYVDFGEGSGVTSCVITGGVARMPTNGGVNICDGGCCTQCLDCDPGLTNFVSVGVNYHFAEDDPTIDVVVAALPETELVQDLVVPTRFSGPLSAIAPGIDELPGTFVTSLDFVTNIGTVCDARFSRNFCF